MLLYASCYLCSGQRRRPRRSAPGTYAAQRGVCVSMRAPVRRCGLRGQAPSYSPLPCASGRLRRRAWRTASDRYLARLACAFREGACAPTPAVRCRSPRGKPPSPSPLARASDGHRRRAWRTALGPDLAPDGVRISTRASVRHRPRLGTAV